MRAEIIDCLIRRLQRRKRRRNPREQRLPRLGQRHTARRAVEKAHTEPRLQRAQHVRHRGWLQIEARRRRTQTAFLGNRHKNRKIRKITCSH